MPNNYFQFKQFTIHHDRCAMKVGTDGVLLGAWTDTTAAGTILDAGSGSGLIALMMAQRSKATIHAVEIEKNTSEQSIENINRSSWKERIFVVNDSFQHFAEETKLRFDLIVSNPPFFLNSLKPDNPDKTTARHCDQLPVGDLMKFSSALLNGNGRLAIIIPYDLNETANGAALSESLFCIRRTIVKTKAGSKPERLMMEFSKKPEPVKETELTIYANENIFSEDYKNLTKDFYLKF
jgi:tRNA1Val (adenine37-N6)-methyltransferase